MCPVTGRTNVIRHFLQGLSALVLPLAMSCCGSHMHGGGGGAFVRTLPGPLTTDGTRGADLPVPPLPLRGGPAVSISSPPGPAQLGLPGGHAHLCGPHPRAQRPGPPPDHGHADVHTDPNLQGCSSWLRPLPAQLWGCLPGLLAAGTKLCLQTSRPPAASTTPVR